MATNGVAPQQTSVHHANNNGNYNGVSCIIRCTYPGCQCAQFSPVTNNVRQCGSCPHGWVPHALDKTNIVFQWSKKKFDPVTYDAVFDIASMVLYGAQGVPFRLHVCLYRLLAQLKQEEAVRITDQFGWTWTDLCRGWMILDVEGNLRNSWTCASMLDEQMILGHFLKFQATQSIAAKFIQELTQQKAEDNPYLDVYKKPADSGLQRFFSQNQPKPVTGPINGHSNGMYPFPSGATQVNSNTVNSVNAGPIPPTTLNGNSVVLQSMPSRRTMQGLNDSVMSVPVPNGTIVFRALQNGALQMHPLSSPDNGQLPRQPAPVNGFNIYPSGPATSPQCLPFPPHVQQHNIQQNLQTQQSKQQPSPAIPAKRTLKPKPSTSSQSATTSSTTSLTPSAILPVDMAVQPANNSANSPNRPGPSSSPPDNAARSEKTPSETSAQSMSAAKVAKMPAKRVNCDVCHKTFCDKGALKIHYSAVHLKEMHRCTVKNCNMMFSSRRSRNRHSSNLNPRLHSNLFAPRRGGILANEGEVPPQASDDMDHSNGEDHDVDMSGSDDDDDFALMSSYEQVSGTGGDAGFSPEPEQRLVIDHLDIDSEMRDVKEQVNQVLLMASNTSTAVQDRSSSAGNIYPVVLVPFSKCPSSTASSPSPVPNSSTNSSTNSSHTTLSFHNNGGSWNAQQLTPMEGVEEEEDDGAYDSDASEPSDTASAFKPTVTVVRDEYGKITVPEDPEEVNRCVVCKKMFKNHFTKRTHYINVHLKIQHPCTVPGCGKQFPSVRSRDRHSANLNLHGQKSSPPPPVEQHVEIPVMPAFSS